MLRAAGWQEFGLKVMASTVILLGLCPLVMPANAQEIADRPIATGRLVWQRDLPTSLRMAQKSQKFVLVDVYTDWCGWCKRLDRDIYSNGQIAKFVDSKFVPLKLNAEDNGQGQSFAKNLQINGYPCTVVLDSTGRVRGMFYGYRKLNEFPAELVKAAGLQSAQPM